MDTTPDPQARGHGPDGASRLARAMLTYLAPPADPLLGSLLEILPADQVLAAIRAGALPPGPALDLPAACDSRTPIALARWRARLTAIAPGAALEAHAQRGVILVCPGDPGWPPQLDDLGPARPYALWARGSTDLQALCANSVAVIGSRAATAYGTHLAGEFAAGLADGCWTIISGAAYGIDAAAHRGALAADGRTVGVLACGPDYAYPREHRGLLDAIATHGAVVSETPPGTLPSRQRFVLRNRIIAALAAGTLVVEASTRSGSITTAWQAAGLGRPLMAVPGPVTSATSAGCHTLIRAGAATCVTTLTEILTELSCRRQHPAKTAASQQPEGRNSGQQAADTPPWPR